MYHWAVSRMSKEVKKFSDFIQVALTARGGSKTKFAIVQNVELILVLYTMKSE